MGSDSHAEQTPPWTAWALVGAVAAVAGLFALSFGDHGYATTDQGFVLGQSWRIHGGQVPYRDFFYIRTPGSLYLHTVWFALPDAWIFRAGRFAYYAQLAVATLVPALFALRAGWVTSPPRLILLCVAFYAVGIHNFPPMPWYTVDGIFFATLALVAVLASRSSATLARRLGWLSVASLLLALASLAKQNYAALVALLVVSEGAFLVMAMRRKNDRESLAEPLLRVIAAGLPPALGYAAVALLLLSAGAWEPFLEQTGAGSSLDALWKAGVVSWLQWPVAGSLLLGAALGRLAHAARWGWLSSLSVALLLSWITWNMTGWLAWSVGIGAGHLLFGGLLGASLASLARRLRSGGSDASLMLPTLHLGTLAIAWSASLSFGANSPLLGLVSAGVVLESLLPHPTRRAPLQLAGWSLVAALAVSQVWQLNAQHPYRSVPREQQTRAYHEIFPRFGRLYGGELLGDRMQELRSLVEIHALESDRDFTVIPGFPLVHFLLDRQTRAPMDWYVLFDLLAIQPGVVARLRQFDGVAFLERHGSDEPCSLDEFANRYRGVSLRVLRRGRLLASTRHFCVVDSAQPPR